MKYLTKQQFDRIFVTGMTSSFDGAFVVLGEMGFITGDVYIGGGNGVFRSMVSRFMEDGTNLPYPEEFKVMTETDIVKEIIKHYE